MDARLTDHEHGPGRRSRSGDELGAGLHPVGVTLLRLPELALARASPAILRLRHACISTCVRFSCRTLLGVEPTHKLNAEELTIAWLAFKMDCSGRAREQLILHYQTLVQIVANRVGSKLPAHVDKGDLVSYGYIGLMDAMDKFDLDRGLKFETYAVTRINGQIIDELRKLDWVPRSVHSQVKEAHAAYLDLEISLQRAPTDAEVARRLGITERQLSASRSEQSYINVLALDAMLDSSADQSPSMLTQLPDRTQSPDFEFEVEGIKNLIASAMDHLSEREAIVLALYYFENLTLSDIGSLLGVTESRICQMHTRAMTQVRSKLSAA